MDKQLVVTSDTQRHPADGEGPGTGKFAVKCSVMNVKGEWCDQTKERAAKSVEARVRRTYPRWSSTIMIMHRTAQMMIMNGQMNLHTRVQMYDRYKQIVSI